MYPGGGPAVVSQDPPWEQGWLWQGSISTSHHWPAVGVGLNVALCFSLCLLPSSFLGLTPALAAQAKGQWGIFSGVGRGGSRMDQMVRLSCGWGLSGFPWSIQLCTEMLAPLLPGLTCVSRQTLAVEGIGQRVAGCSACGVTGPVQTLIHVPLTAQPHKSRRTGTVEASRFGGAGSMVVTGLGLTSIRFL